MNIIIIVVAGYPFPDSEPNIWQSIRSKIEQIAHATLFQLGHIPGRSPSSIANQVSGMLRVIRMSATSKFIGNIILSGSLKAIHVHIQDITGTARPKPADGSKNSFVDCGRHLKTAAYSSISVFTDLVEAVEIALVVADGHSHLLEEKVPAAVLVESSSSPPPRGFKAWRLNKQGIIAFMEALRSASEVEQMKMNDGSETQGWCV